MVIKKKTAPRRQRCKPTPIIELSRKVDAITGTLADVQSDLKHIQAAIDALKSPSTVTQAELDGIKAQTGKALSDLQSLVITP